MQAYTLRIRKTDRNVFLAICDGRKKVETRAAIPKYQKIKTGDTLRFICGKDIFERRVRKVERFRSVAGLLHAYRPLDINPQAETERDLRTMYRSFPRYPEKIRRYGIVAWTLAGPRG